MWFRNELSSLAEVSRTSLYDTPRLVFIFEAHNVLCDVRTESLYSLIFQPPFPWRNTYSRPGPPYYPVFTITFRNTTLSRTPLDEWSAQHTDLCLTTHNTHDRRAVPRGIRARSPSKQRPQTHDLRQLGGLCGADLSSRGDLPIVCVCVCHRVW